MCRALGIGCSGWGMGVMYKSVGLGFWDITSAVEKSHGQEQGRVNRHWVYTGTSRDYGKRGPESLPTSC